MKRALLLLLLIVLNCRAGQQNVDLTAVTGYVQVIAAPTNPRPIRIHTLDISWDPASPTTFRIAYGKGTNCGTGTVVIATLKNVTSWSRTWATIQLDIPPQNAVCLYFGTSVSPGGNLTYAN
jgi:hypothetical protein